MLGYGKLISLRVSINARQMRKSAKRPLTTAKNLRNFSWPRRKKTALCGAGEISVNIVDNLKTRKPALAIWLVFHYPIASEISIVLIGGQNGFHAMGASFPHAATGNPEENFGHLNLQSRLKGII